MALFVLAFGCILIFVASRLGRRKYDKVKFQSYECGIEVQEKRDTKISVKFYLTAILFIIFDIEIIFMYPWAVNFREFIQSGMGVYVFTSMMIFLFLNKLD
jgi:NADH-quinone oxidoreductase subunit A